MSGGPRVELTARDRDLLDVLTRRVRVMSVGQIASTWWSETKSPTDGAARRLRILVGEALVRIEQARFHPELELQEPVFSWKPGSEAPDPGTLAYRLSSRWTEPYVTRGVAIATESAGNMFGGDGGRMPRPSELTHDIGLAQVYLWYRRNRSREARTWQSEATLYENGMGRDSKLPDAMVKRVGEPVAVEFAGAYSKNKISELHEFFESENYTYELW